MMAYWQTKYLKQVHARARDPILYIIAAITIMIALVNISTRLSDAENYAAPIKWQNPVTSELSSAAALIILLPFVFAFFDHYSFTIKTWRTRLVLYIASSILFSVAHVFLMVLMRQAAWPILLDAPYNFFAGGAGELLYEYRKDAITFILFVFFAGLQRQLKVAQAAEKKDIEPLTLKSGATTILLQPAEFLYAKSAGNYAEVTSFSGTQLARITLAELETALQARGCDAVRIHRSCLVNLIAIMETSPLAGGDLSIKLKDGETLRASRRYREKLKAFTDTP
jgi:hypothetical protein